MRRFSLLFLAAVGACGHGGSSKPSPGATPSPAPNSASAHPSAGQQVPADTSKTPADSSVTTTDVAREFQAVFGDTAAGDSLLDGVAHASLDTAKTVAESAAVT